MNGRDFFFFFSENLPPKASTFLLSLKCMKILKSKRPLSVLWLRMSFLRIKHSLVEMPMDRFLCSGRDLHSVGHLSGNCERHVYPQRSENLVLLHEASSLTVASVLVRVGWPLSRCLSPSHPGDHCSSRRRGARGWRWLHRERGFFLCNPLW